MTRIAEVIAQPVAGAPGVVAVTLRHAGRLNAMSRGMWRQLRTVFERLHRDASVRAVLIEGADGAFCAGGDISEYPDFRFDAAALRDFHENDVWGGLKAMLDCDVPIVAHIEGACMGAGVEIASCCDIRVASAQARFGAPIARLGFPMAPREARLVASAVGAVTARQMLLEAASFSAADMLQRGFLSRVAEPQHSRVEALGSAQRIAALAPAAARMNKQTFRALQQIDASERPEYQACQDRPESVESPAGKAPNAMNSGANMLLATPADPYAYADSHEHREGIAAFLEKRPPVFRDVLLP